MEDEEVRFEPPNDELFQDGYRWLFDGNESTGNGSAIYEAPSSYDGARDFTQLRVWQAGIDLAVLIYRTTARFPSEERYGLTAQLRRASVSVPSNIAEGNARNTTGDYLRFLSIARGSLSEMKTQMIIAERLGFVDTPSFDHVVGEISSLIRQVTSLHNAISRSRKSS